MVVGICRGQVVVGSSGDPARGRAVFLLRVAALVIRSLIHGDDATCDSARWPGPWYPGSSRFAGAFGVRGRPGISPGQLMMASVLQFSENLTDRQAAEAVRDRMTWKYALGLELEDPGFDASVLSEFRSRLVAVICPELSGQLIYG